MKLTTEQLDYLIRAINTTLAPIERILKESITHGDLNQIVMHRTANADAVQLFKIKQILQAEHEKVSKKEKFVKIES